MKTKTHLGKLNTPGPGQFVLAIILGAIALCCLLPVLLVVVASFSDEQSITHNGFTFFPDAWSLDGWRYVIGYGKQLITSYIITISRTVIHTLGSLTVMSMLAYTLARRQFPLRNFLSMMLLITMLFSGGSLSNFLINTTVYHLKDTYLILVIPTVNAMNVIIIRTYIQTNVTDSLIEAAKIDGAGEFRIFTQIVIPLLPPVLASVGFMHAVSIWNDWETGYMYIQSDYLMPLQNLLRRVEENVKLLSNPDISMQATLAIGDSLPANSARMALLMTVLGPIMIIYPFFQKYFIKGLTLGSVKG